MSPKLWYTVDVPERGAHGRKAGKKQMFSFREHGKEVSSVKDLYSKPIDGRRKAIALGLIKKVCREYGYERCMPKSDTANQTTSIEVKSKGGKDHE